VTVVLYFALHFCRDYMLTVKLPKVAAFYYGLIVLDLYDFIQNSLKELMGKMSLANPHFVRL